LSSFRSRMLAGGRLAALAAGGLFLRSGAALGRRRPRRAGMGALAAATGRVGRVGDARRPLLRHSLVLQRLVLLLVLDVGALARHGVPPFLRNLLGGQRAGAP